MAAALKNKVVSREDWVKARKDLLETDKAFTRERDKLAAARCRGKVLNASHTEIRILPREMEALHATAALFRSHPRSAAPNHIAGKVKELLAAGTLELLREKSDS